METAIPSGLTMRGHAVKNEARSEVDRSTGSGVHAVPASRGTTDDVTGSPIGVRRYELFGPSSDRFGNPAPLGLLGLAIACAALVPIALGASATAPALATGAMYALLFGGGCQFLAGLMMFGNKNGFGGTVFTCFSFLWAMNAWSLHSISTGVIPDHGIGLAVEIALFVIFAGLTWGFGHIARALFIFLLDVDALFAFRIVRSVAHTKAMELPIAGATIFLALVGLWLAFGALLSPVVGRPVFPVGPPVFQAKKAKGFDWTPRRALFEVLYAQFEANAFAMLSRDELVAALASKGVTADPTPNLMYLSELGYVVIENEGGRIARVRLHATGVDIHEQLALGKYAPAAAGH